MLKELILACAIVGGIADVKCGGALPLQNTVGLDLFCGVGAPACPLGSYCDVGNDVFGRYAVCCPGTLLLPPLVVAPVATTVVNKCTTGLPVSVLGIELFCGSGLGHVDCPIGTQCTSDILMTYSVCCPVAAECSNVNT